MNKILRNYDKGYTVYQDGKKVQVCRNLSNNGYTAYHQNGSKTQVCKNISNDGYTAYHQDGSKIHVYKNITNDGYNFYNSGINHDLDGFYLLGGAFLLLITVVCAFKTAGAEGVIPCFLFCGPILTSILPKRSKPLECFKYFEASISLLGFKLFLNVVWNNAYLDPETSTFGLIGVFIIAILGIAVFMVYSSPVFATIYAISLPIIVVLPCFGIQYTYIYIGLILIASLITFFVNRN